MDKSNREERPTDIKNLPPYEALRDFLANHGWSLDCWSPLEISNDVLESKATGVAAQMVVAYLVEANR